MSAVARQTRRVLGVAAALLRVGFHDAIAYRSELFIWLLSTNTPLIMMILWTRVAADAPVGHYDEKGFFAYFLATLIVRLLTGAWVVWEINMEVRGGQLSMRLLRPLHPFFAYAAENLSAWPLRFLLCIPIFFITYAVVGPSAFAHDGFSLGLFPLALFGAWALTFSAMLFIGTLALYWQSSLSLFDLWLGLYFVLSGYVVPLDLFPAAAQPVLSMLPFKYVLSFPVQLALGRLDRAAALENLGHQWLYVASFLVGALYLWRRGLRRFEAFGN